jgi:hypothetical protein
MLHVDVLESCIGILSLEWAVLPPGNSNEQIPDAPVAMATFELERILASIFL